MQPKIGKHHYKAEEILKAIGNGKTHEGEAIAKRYMLTTGALWRKDTKRLQVQGLLMKPAHQRRRVGENPETSEHRILRFVKMPLPLKVPLRRK